MNAWGKEALIDIKDSTPVNKVHDPEYLKAWVKDLVKAIDMVAYGEPNVVHFGVKEIHLTGWTVIQLIETSNICAHFNDHDGSACINVFSCKDFDPAVVVKQIENWFNPSSIVIKVVNRLE